MQQMMHSRVHQHARWGNNAAHTQQRVARVVSSRASASSSSSSTRPLAPLDIPAPGFDSIQSALDDLAAGKFLVVLDDADRENEGDLILAADRCTPEAMHFMVEHTSGVICIGMRGADLDRLKLPLMVSSAENEEAMYTAFTVTVDLRHGTSTGISASDRSATLRALADPAYSAADFKRPGHIFPLRAQPQGVLVRPGHTEAAVDLSRLAGCAPAGVLCEIVDRRDGSMARTPQLLEFAAQHGLKCITIADLVRYRMAHDVPLEAAGSQPVETAHGQATAHAFRCPLDGAEHVALVAGDVAGQAGVPVEVVVEEGVEEVFAAVGRARLEDSVRRVVGGGQPGVVLYLRRGQEGPGPLPHWRTNGELQGLLRWGVAAQALRQLGVASAVVGGEQAEEHAAALREFGLEVAAAPAGSSGTGVHNASQNGNGVGSNGHLGRPMAVL